MKMFFFIGCVVIGVLTQAHGQVLAPNRSFMVEAVVRDVDCQSGDPWQPAYQQLFSKLQRKADDICRAFNIQARLDRNISFKCESSLLAGAQSFSCLPMPIRDCSYGKCCPNGICD